MPGESGPGDLRARLQSRLREAMKARDTAAVAALRGALGAIGNAEAVDTNAQPAPVVGDGPIAGAVRGLGAGEVARRELSDADVEVIVRSEIADRVAAAEEYDGLGRPEEAAELRAQCEALRSALD